MAENQFPSGNDADQKKLQSQIDGLRQEIERLRERAADKASSLYEDGASGLRAAADTARENPGTVATMFTTAALIGALIGFVLGQASAEHHHRSHRWY